MRIKRPLKERLLEHIIPEPNSGCWLWTASLINKDGYGSIKVDGVTKMPHRMSYEVFKGPIENGLLVLHKCDTPCCINPDHLFLGTSKENTHDMMRKNRAVFPKGEGSGHARLKNEDIYFIRSNPHIKGKDLSKMFNITPTAISKIRLNKRWKHI
jgi:hypothetical protein